MLQQMVGKVFFPSGVSLEPIHSSLTDKEIMDGLSGKHCEDEEKLAMMQGDRVMLTAR